MSADNLVRVKQKENGKFQVRHESASSLVHALAGVDPTDDELLIEIVADDVDEHGKALEFAHKFVRDYEDDGGEVEYGVVDDDWKK